MNTFELKLKTQNNQKNNKSL